MAIRTWAIEPSRLSERNPDQRGVNHFIPLLSLGSDIPSGSEDWNQQEDVMETIFIKDTQRIRSLGIMTTFQVEDGQVTWNVQDPQDVAYKFLVISGRLVIAPISDHTELYAVWSTLEEEPTRELKDRVRKIAEAQWGARNHLVTAAGKMSADGNVTGWKSDGFRVETPIHLREEIAQEVRKIITNQT